MRRNIHAHIEVAFIVCLYLVSGTGFVLLLDTLIRSIFQ